MDQVPDDVLELAQVRLALERSAPPGWEVVDVWRCRTCCEDFHAIARPPAGTGGSRAERREAARARRSGARHG